MRLNSSHYQDVQKFLDYFLNLKKWADDKLLDKLVLAEKARVANLRAEGKRPREKSREALRQEDYIFSDSTDIGLIVTLKVTLVVKFLIEECNFQFVMTARLNQNALERFFGLVRQSCGANTHPEPRVFAQLFRLLSVYSLVKPMRGSNITGGDMVTTLLNLDDLKSKTREERQKAFMDKLDAIVIDRTHLDEVPDIIESVNHDINYILEGESIDEFGLSYVAGFVSRHSKRVIEEKLLLASLDSGMEENFIFVVLDKLENIEVPKIGCELHENDLTKAVMKFYRIFRMHFLTRRWNEKVQEQKKKQRAYRKQAHLT